MNEAQLRILIADDHELVRRGVREVIEAEPGWTVCAEAENGRVAVELARRCSPDVAVVDVSMPELNGVEAARQLRHEVEGCDIVMLTLYDSHEMVRQALVAGARAYVLKSDASTHLVQAIRAVRQHGTYLTGRAQAHVVDRYLHAQSESGGAPASARSRDVLSPREREVVQMLAEGRCNKQVAAALGISVKTAETHRTNVMRKLDLHGLSDLVRYAIRNGLAQP